MKIMFRSLKTMHEVADTVYSEAEKKSGTVFTSHNEDSEHSPMSKGDIKTKLTMRSVRTVLIPQIIKVHHVHNRDMYFPGTVFTVFMTITTFSMILSCSME
jgi:hypothetical protein